MLFGLAQPPGVVAADLREADRVGVLLLQRRRVAPLGENRAGIVPADDDERRLAAAATCEAESTPRSSAGVSTAHLPPTRMPAGTRGGPRRNRRSSTGWSSVGSQRRWCGADTPWTTIDTTAQRSRQPDDRPGQQAPSILPRPCRRRRWRSLLYCRAARRSLMHRGDGGSIHADHRRLDDQAALRDGNADGRRHPLHAGAADCCSSRSTPTTGSSDSASAPPTVASLDEHGGDRSRRRCSRSLLGEDPFTVERLWSGWPRALAPARHDAAC